MRHCLILMALIAMIGNGRALADSRLSVVADFQGASVRVLEIDQKSCSVRFMPGGDPRRGWPCWWYFRVDGLTAKDTLSLQLQRSPAAIDKRKPLSASWSMPKYATFSTDGKTWQQTDQGSRQDEWMVYKLKPKTKSVFVAWGPPYTPRTASTFAHEISKQSGHATAVELCRSRDGRTVPMLHVKAGKRSDKQRFGVWVQARQHAWESGSSWVAQGFAKWLLGKDKQAAWLRQHAEVFIVPVMDVDNTATGNGGKNALPHDHNRDWSRKPHWNEVRAAQRKVGKLIDEQRMDVFLDLHNPAPSDPSFFYILPSEMSKEPMISLRDRFISLAYARISKVKPQLPMSSKSRVTGASYHPLWRQISANWVSMHGNPQTVSLCLETMWNHKNSTPTVYQAVGANLAAAVAEYLAERPER